MAEQDNAKADLPQNAKMPLSPRGGGGTGPISGVGGMSPAERIQYIQEIQKSSPLGRISETLKNITLDSFGLAKSIFDNRTALFKDMRGTYQKIREKRKEIAMNQHINGLTENVRGVERIKHELDPGVNVDLIDGPKADRSKGLYVDSNWAPKKKGQIE